MKNSKLTPEQIESLFDFCYDQDVSEYEIQAELVDHLASAIETQLGQQPETSFDDALLKAFSDFGQSGFKELVKSKKRAFRNKYNRMFLKFTGTFFQLPRIILTMGLTFSLFTVFQYLNQRQLAMEIAGGLAICAYVWYILFYHPKRLYIHEREDQSFLIVNYFNSLKSLTMFLLVGFQVITNSVFQYFTVTDAVWFNLFLSSMITLLFISSYALMFYMPKLVKQHFEEQFPQFVKS